MDPPLRSQAPSPPWEKKPQRMRLFTCLPLSLSPSQKEEKVLLLTPESCLQSPLSAEDRQWISDNGGRRGSHGLTLDYHHYSPHAVLTAVLPPDSEEIPTGFEVVGHIAHFNLRREFLPYKTLIGKLSGPSRPKMWKRCPILLPQSERAVCCSHVGGLYGSNGLLQHMHWTLDVSMQSATCACMQHKCRLQMWHM